MTNENWLLWGFGLEATYFIFAGAIRVALEGLIGWILSVLLLGGGAFTAYYVGKGIEKNTIEKYKRGEI
jgi:hypothetical protein